MDPTIAAPFNEDWTAEVVGQMHKYRITGQELSAACEYAPGKHYTPEYLSQVLQGRKQLENAERTKCVVIGALEMVKAVKIAEAEAANDKSTN